MQNLIILELKRVPLKSHFIGLLAANIVIVLLSTFTSSLLNASGGITVTGLPPAQLDKGSFEWLLCPICNSKTRIKMRPDTELINFPLFCPKCRKETLIHVKKFKVSVITEPDAQTQSR